MKKGAVSISALLITMAFLIAGCTSEVYSYDNFINDLLDSGASVQVGEEINKGDLSVEGRYVLVNGERIQVFEYDNATLANEQVARIAPDLSSIESADGVIYAYSFAGPTHYYSKGRLIVVYFDDNFIDDPSMINLLENILGPQFAGTPTTPIPSTMEPLSLQIDSPEDGGELNVNVQKVSGVVSDPEATVRVNGVEAKVNQDGDFYAYIDLTKGENTIEAGATRGNDTHSETITVSFSPELAVYLDIESESGVDYNITPVTVTGWVSDAEATVTVDGNQVQVTEDGSFLTQVKLKEDTERIEAVATLDGQEDRMFYLIGLSPEGRLLPVPGWSIFYMSKVHYENDVQLKAGETKSLDFALETKSDLRWPSRFSYEIYKVGGEYEEDKLPMPDGLEMFMEPSSFMAYPNTVYRFSITVETAAELAPGKYYFRFEQHLEDGFRGGGWIAVTVEG